MAELSREYVCWVYVGHFRGSLVVEQTQQRILYGRLYHESIRSSESGTTAHTQTLHIISNSTSRRHYERRSLPVHTVCITVLVSITARLLFCRRLSGTHPKWNVFLFLLVAVVDSSYQFVTMFWMVNYRWRWWFMMYRIWSYWRFQTCLPLCFAYLRLTIVWSVRKRWLPWWRWRGRQYD